MAAYLIDTNVLMAASAAVDTASDALKKRSMPIDLLQRRDVLRWVKNFEMDLNAYLVLDEQGTIQSEYFDQLPFNEEQRDQEYGILVWQEKFQTKKVHEVPIDLASHPHDLDRAAKLPPALEAIVTQSDDRKWVAAVVSTKQYLEINPPIVYAAETDWFKLKDDLLTHDVHVTALLPNAWYEQRLGD
jgi:hypothetical protein